MRTSIEEKWWADPRRSYLVRQFSNSTAMADGIALNFWRIAQEYWKNDQLIPKDIFKLLEGSEQLIAAGLAEHRENGIYARGANEFLSWAKSKMLHAKEAGRRGGLASANSRKGSYDGNSNGEIGGGKQKASKTQANANQNEANGKQDPSKTQAEGKQSSSKGEAEPKQNEANGKQDPSKEQANVNQNEASSKQNPSTEQAEGNQSLSKEQANSSKSNLSGSGSGSYSVSYSFSNSINSLTLPNPLYPSPAPDSNSDSGSGSRSSDCVSSFGSGPASRSASGFGSCSHLVQQLVHEISPAPTPERLKPPGVEYDPDLSADESESAKMLERVVNEELLAGWRYVYGENFVAREFKRVFVFYYRLKRKRPPKNRDSWHSTLSSWLEKSAKNVNRWSQSFSTLSQSSGAIACV